MNTSVQNVRHAVTIRFAGDSGDGIQLTGERFTTTSAMMGEEVATLSDFPAEIRAPAGSVGGVSGFQLTFGADDVFTAGDNCDALVVMNPAALKMNIKHLKKNGVLIVNQDSFEAKNLSKAGYEDSPLTGNMLTSYQVFPVSITKMTQASLKDTGLTPKEMDRCKNFFSLGLTFWMFQRDLEPTINWLDKKFAKKPHIAEANKLALQGGWNYGESTEIFAHTYTIEKVDKEIEPGVYRHITGNVAVALGLTAAATKAEIPLYLASYPITPATEILQELSKLKNYNVTTYQAEDEIAAIGASIGASFGGALAATSTSGPGFALKSEFLNLAIITELPLVVVNVQRGGPSTGLPTKMEQADLLQTMWGRNGESPCVVMAAESPKDCFYAAVEASRIALKYMTPVVLLSDNSLSNGAEVWKVPNAKDLPEFELSQFKGDISEYEPYMRDKDTLARPWMVPGTPGGEHRIGGLEKQDRSGYISYDPDNHQKMIQIRAEKVQKVANELPPSPIYGAQEGDLLVLSWGSTYGVSRMAAEKLHKEGHRVGAVNLRYINPLPNDLQEIISKFDKVLVPEVNMGQLWLRLQAEFGQSFERFNRVFGIPMKEYDLTEAILNCIKGEANV